MKFYPRYLTIEQAILSSLVGVIGMLAGGYWYAYGKTLLGIPTLIVGLGCLAAGVLWVLNFKEQWNHAQADRNKEEPIHIYWMNRFFSFSCGMTIVCCLLSMIGIGGVFFISNEHGYLFYVLLGFFVLTFLLCMVQLIVLSVEYVQDATEDDHDQDYPTKSLHEEIHEELKQNRILIPAVIQDPAVAAVLLTHMRMKAWQPWPNPSISYQPWLMIAVTLNDRPTLIRIEKAVVPTPIHRLLGGSSLEYISSARALNLKLTNETEKDTAIEAATMASSYIVSDVADLIHLELTTPSTQVSPGKYFARSVENGKDLYMAFGEDKSTTTYLYRTDAHEIPSDTVGEVNQFMKDVKGTRL